MVSLGHSELTSLHLEQNLHHSKDIYSLMQKRRSSIANALELHFFCIKPSIYVHILLFDTG